MRPAVDGPVREYVRMPPPTLDSLRAAPETIAVGGLRIVAGAVLWLNLMPGPDLGDEPAGPPVLPLRGTIDIHPADTAGAKTLPAGLALQGAWLLAGDSTWALGVVASDSTRATSRSLALDVWGGPGWLGRDSSADVVVRVRRPDGAPLLLGVRGVRVEVSE
ncbi:MAG: hypothetical protein KY467_06045 [Gemmatimonadetes bacterium]|nr:hypothetical protein [Gemmatimonadota bacterium]